MNIRQQILEAFAINLTYGRHLLSETPADQFTRRPAPGMNHAAWIAGHITLGHRRVATHLGADVHIPDGWIDLFGRDTKPLDDLAAYPKKDDLYQAFLEGHEVLANAYIRATDEQLAAPNQGWKPAAMSTVGAMAIHVMTTHESFHLGQLSAWRRALGFPHVDVTGGPANELQAK